MHRCDTRGKSCPGAGTQGLKGRRASHCQRPGRWVHSRLPHCSWPVAARLPAEGSGLRSRASRVPCAPAFPWDAQDGLSAEAWTRACRGRGGEGSWHQGWRCGRPPWAWLSPAVQAGPQQGLRSEGQARGSELFLGVCEVRGPGGEHPAPAHRGTQPSRVGESSFLLPSADGLTLDRSEPLDVHFLICPVTRTPRLLWELDQMRQISKRSRKWAEHMMLENCAAPGDAPRVAISLGQSHPAGRHPAEAGARHPFSVSNLGHLPPNKNLVRAPCVARSTV